MRLEISNGFSRASDSIVYSMLFGMMLIQIAFSLHVESVQSVGVLLIFISSIASLVFTYKTKWSDINFLLLIFIIVSLFLSMLCSLRFSYQSLVSAVCFLEIPLLMCSFRDIKGEKIRKAIYLCFTILSIYYIVLSFTRLSHIYYGNYGAMIADYLTLGYNNPNETAMHLFVCLIVLISACIDCQGGWKRCLVLAEIIAIVVLILETKSRTGIIAMALFIFLVWIYQNRIIPIFFCSLSFMAPIVFVMLSLWQESSSWGVLGDSFDTGREAIYRRVLSNIDIGTLLFGNYNFEFQNLHNAFWSVFGTIGLVGTFPFLTFLYSNVKNMWKHIWENQTNQVSLIGFMLLIVYSSTEAAYFVGGSNYAAEVISVYLLCMCSSDAIDYKKEYV